MISPQIIEELKYRNDIEDVISGYVTLKRAGSNLVGLCPFHSERSPSFTVFTGTRSFYCFGCGAGGDVISFVMRAENLDYMDALRYLAKRAGIELPDDGTGQTGGVNRERILAMNREAAKFFFSELGKSPVAQEYIAKRGLSSALVRHFGIGYAPDDWQALAKHLSSVGFTKEEMSAGFLCSVSKRNGNSYDIFRNRIMFPVIDVRGDIIAFGGRTIGKNPEEPKYINSSDTPVFNKRRNLFALNFAKNSCAEQIILCEGYMDVVSLHGAGFTNAVASCGTALTADQARLMRKYSKSAIISYDADEAGQRAADKAFALLGEAGLEARLLKVEDAKDPDEYIRKFGKDGFSRLLSRSRSRFDFKFSSILAANDVNTPDGRIKAAGQAAEVIAGIWSEVERDVYTRQVCGKLGLSYDGMKNDVARLIAKRNKKEKAERNSAVIREAEGFGDRVNPDRIKNVGAAGAEDTVIGILAMYPELIPQTAEKTGLAPDDFVTDFNRRVYEKMLSLGKGFDIGLLGEDFSADEVSRVIKYTVSRQGLTDNGMKVVAQCVEKLKKSREKEGLSLEDLIAKKRQRDKQ